MSAMAEGRGEDEINAGIAHPRSVHAVLKGSAMVKLALVFLLFLAYNNDLISFSRRDKHSSDTLYTPYIY